MPPHVLTLRLTPYQNKVLQLLSGKLGIDKTNVIRLAIARLAKAEGALPKPNAKK